MSAPKRIQRKRTKGWRMPEGAIYVGRPGRWGSPFPVGHVIDRVHASGPGWGRSAVAEIIVRNRADSVQAYREWLGGTPMLTDSLRPSIDEIRAELAGHDLCCWCPLEDAEGNPVPCHADVLLELANGAVR